MNEPAASCFFCAPDESRIVGRMGNFYLICGLGPIVEGYVILASKRHTPSMLDLEGEAFQELQEVLPRVSSFVKRSYGPSILLEHGRIPACTHYDSKGHDRHCYHAHLLIFPTPADIREGMVSLGFRPESYGTWAEARDSFPKEREYLFFGDAAGGLHFARVPGVCPRQFLRHLVAKALGKPDEADWNRYPNWDMVRSAVARYTSSGGAGDLVG